MESRVALFAAVIVGLVVAGWHTTVAMQAMFVFRENEPLTSWLALVPAPLLTVIGCIVAVFQRLAGGITVIAGGLIAAVAFLVGEGGITEHVAPYLLTFTTPVVAIGVALILLGRSTPIRTTHAT